MRVRRVRLLHFRNYEALDLCPAPGANLFVGHNGQGKTNLLEALSILATTRSPRTGRDADLVQWNAASALVSAEIERERRADVTLDLELPHDGEKVLRINTGRRPRLVDLLGELNLVSFWVEDIELARGDPAERRRFLNAAICQISPGYCHELARYRRVLDHRNHLLKDLPRSLTVRPAALEVWDRQLAHYGASIVRQRQAFVDALQRPAAAAHGVLTEGEETLTLAYEPTCPVSEADEAGERQFHAALDPLFADELRRGVTLAGPHRDELLFRLDGRDARLYGSLGQQRTIVLSLRLAELEAMREQLGEEPVVALDDVFAELDAGRVRRLLQQALPGRQSFAVTTESSRLPSEVVEAAQVWQVRRGAVERAG